MNQVDKKIVDTFTILAGEKGTQTFLPRDHTRLA